MLTTLQEREAVSYIPNIACPCCGEHLRLATVEPEGSDNRHQMHFDCECGFDYRMSDRARRGR